MRAKMLLLQKAHLLHRMLSMALLPLCAFREGTFQPLMDHRLFQYISVLILQSVEGLKSTINIR